MEKFVFLTELMYKRVYDARGKPFGTVVDFAADALEHYPKINAFIYRPGGVASYGKRLRLSWDDVAWVERGHLRVRRPPAEAAEPFERRPGEVLLVEDVLDKQIVDVNGAKVERVNDVHMLHTERDLRVAHADVGFRGLLRRLNFLKAFDAVTAWLFSYTVKEQLIPWRFVQPLGEAFSVTNIQLSVARQRLGTLHPADLADIIEDLPQRERAAIFGALDIGTAAETLEEVEDEELQVDLLEAVGPERAGDIIEEMDPDEAADVLQELDERQAHELIADMEGERAEDLRELMAQDEGTAGAIMTTEFVAVGLRATAADALQAVRDAVADVETYGYIHVLNGDEELAGIFSLREALVAQSATAVADIMEKRVVAVKTDAKLGDVAELFGKYGFATLPVVDDDNRLRGIITLYDAVAAVYPEFVKD